MYVNMYGNAVNLEGKSTMTYSTTRGPVPLAGYSLSAMQSCGQMIYGPTPAPMPGPGYFSSPERPTATYGTSLQSPGGQLGLHGLPLALSHGMSQQIPKPDLVTGMPVAGARAARGGMPPNAIFTSQAGMISQGGRTIIMPSNLEAASLTGNSLIKMDSPITKVISANSPVSATVTVPTHMVQVISPAIVGMPLTIPCATAKSATSFPMTFNAIPVTNANAVKSYGGTELAKEACKYLLTQTKHLVTTC